MSKQDYYFQFPLSVLTYADTVHSRCDSIISYCLCSVGPSLWNNLPDGAQEEKLDLMIEAGGKPSELDWEDERHVPIMYARYSMGITGGNIEHDLRVHDAISKHVRDFERRHGKDASLRIKGNLVFEVRDAKGMSYREFAVLCAIYSVVGAKVSPVRITLDTIRARSLGYKSSKALNADVEAGVYKINPCLENLTRKQLHDTKDKLHQLRWFAAATYGRRQTYYSHRLSDDDLRQKIVATKTFTSDFKAARARKDDALTAAVNAQRARNKASLKRGQQPVERQGY